LPTGQLTPPHGTTAGTQLFPPTHLEPVGQPVVLRSVQVIVHAPPEHLPLAQVVPHFPQFAGSVWVSTQPLVQAVRGAAQVHAPPTQVVPPVQAVWFCQVLAVQSWGVVAAAGLHRLALLEHSPVQPEAALQTYGQVWAAGMEHAPPAQVPRA
jgi:hypothetical protein